MARPIKNNADYFPHPKDLRNDRRCKALRSKFGLPGYAVYQMILETLTHADNFRIAYNQLEIELLAGDFDIDSSLLYQILDYCLLLGLLLKENEFMYSLDLETAMNPLIEYREKERERNQQRKTKTKEVYPMVNDGIEKQTTIHHTVNETETKIYPVVNPPSKGKKSKEKLSIESKEKGEKKTIPHSSNLDKSLKNKKGEEKEKSSAKKEKEAPEAVFERCKAYFLSVAQVYIWEAKDDSSLISLLEKISITLGDSSTPERIAESFQFLLKQLPKYWRSKKFTITHINYNFNEIINEIRNKNGDSKSGSNNKFGRHHTVELAHRAQTFGRKGSGD